MIPLNDFRRQWEDTRIDALAAFDAVGSCGWYILGRETAEFERELAGWWGVPHAVGVASGLDAIELSLKALGCGPGDRVLTTPLSAFATTLAILKSGAVPVFVDTDEFGLIDLERCREALTARPDIRFFVPVHLYGHALDMTELAALRNRFECKIVEDCAQSIGASHRGVATGTAGDLAAVSFYPTKNLGALGDGGAILTGDPRLAETVRTLRDYGQSAKYRHEAIGYNSRLDELHASYLRRVALPRLAAWTAARQRIARAYLENLRNEANLAPGSPPGSDSCWHLFPVYVERKERLMNWLRQHGVTCGEHYPALITEQPAMAAVSFEVFGELATAARIARREVSLPIHPYLTNEEVAHVVDACNSWRG